MRRPLFVKMSRALSSGCKILQVLWAGGRADGSARGTRSGGREARGGREAHGRGARRGGEEARGVKFQVQGIHTIIFIGLQIL